VRKWSALNSLNFVALVVIFGKLALSGFFVGGSVLNAGRGFSSTQYAVARLSRLWTVLLPALAFTCMADIVTSNIDPRILSLNRCFFIYGPQDYSRSLVTLLGNVFFLQDIYVAPYGSNSPLWSLPCEFWYYVMFPMFALALGRCGKSRTLTRIMVGLLAAGILCWLPFYIRWRFSIWPLGVLLWVNYSHNHSSAATESTEVGNETDGTSRYGGLVLLCGVSLFLGSLI
jgi:peptidoglycan/LPS O-acetylase OafA/YrhL